jgi:hypothetical protein
MIFIVPVMPAGAVQLPVPGVVIKVFIVFPLAPHFRECVQAAVRHRAVS